ncbi:sensor domain-containing diguanylate cyclase [Nitrosomonas sp.]|uniref:GGDEF domain-containing protein n=1 Tax=Nitrosomonas sp. TaxID=42353 RepID=UPI001D57DDBB|nr:sensor domain-containing diguanylate cyclase [Nitrosomonas sp.]MCB1947726.1 sensor domain-containing diguanylate cyclase [Nitrosomonas sp.]
MSLKTNTLAHARNRQLQNTLNDLIQQARENEKKQALYETLGFEIIGAGSPEALLELVLTKTTARCQLNEVVLCLIDHHKDIKRLFFNHDDEVRTLYENRLAVLDNVKDTGFIDSLIRKPLLGTEALKKYRWMIADIKTRSLFKSAAYLPLMRGNRIIGALLLLSHNSNRFPQDAGTLFLQKLSIMAAVAIENCLNQQRIKEISYQDVLTGVYNRRYFDLRFKDEIARSLRWRDDLVCMFLDVDYFKKINDTYGHQTGDQVLTCIANLIKSQVRACDIVARYGGEEFVAALPATSLQHAHEIAERLRQTVQSTVHYFQDKPFYVTISIGMANFKSLDMLKLQDRPNSEEIAAALLDKADKALYQAKANGRNQIVVHTSDINNP